MRYYRYFYKVQIDPANFEAELLKKLLESNALQDVRYVNELKIPSYNRAGKLGKSATMNRRNPAEDEEVEDAAVEMYLDTRQLKLVVEDPHPLTEEETRLRSAFLVLPDEGGTDEITVSRPTVAVKLWEAKQINDFGIVSWNPITQLNGRFATKLLGQFYEDYEFDYYWWSAYEMVRRFTQTGMVLVFRLVGGDVTSLLFGLVVALGAVVMQARYRPYLDDDLDKLQFVVLFNQCLVQILMLCMYASPARENAYGISMVVLQTMCVTYGLQELWPLFKELFETWQDLKRDARPGHARLTQVLPNEELE
eukprot:gene26019-31855_t